MGVIPSPFINLPVQVAFLIGNGFDLGLGLKTSYRDFINFYLNKDEDDGVLDSEKETIQIFKEQIRKDIDCWSDAELEFGRFKFSKINPNLDVEEIFTPCADDFQCSLCKYLREQDRLMIENVSGAVAKTFEKTLLEIAQPKQWFRVSVGKGDRAVRINIVNFNYTLTVDRLIKRWKKNENLRNITETSEEFEYRLENVIHVHGNLNKPDEIVFGVNEVSQIDDMKLRDYSAIYGYGIKPIMAAREMSASYNQAKEVIKNANIIVLFGLSYGATDCQWWDIVLDKVINQKTKLILCPFTDMPRELTSYAKRMQAKRRELEKLLRYTGYNFNNEVKEILITQINFLNLYGPYPDPENGESYYCDPLHLNYFKRHCIQGAD